MNRKPPNEVAELRARLQRLGQALDALQRELLAVMALLPKS